MFEFYLWTVSTFIGWSMLFCGALVGYRRRRDRFSVMELAGTSALMAWIILDFVILQLQPFDLDLDLLGDFIQSYGRIQSIVVTVALLVFAAGYLGTKRVTPTTSPVDADHAA